MPDSAPSSTLQPPRGEGSVAATCIDESDLARTSPTADDGRLQRPPPQAEPGASRLRSLWKHLLKEHRHPNRMGIAVFVGIVIGATPLYGFHLLLCLAVATVFRLNKLTVYLVANISNPLVAPILLAVEVMIGEWLLHGTVVWLDPENIKTLGLATVAYRFFVSAFVGSLALGVALGTPLGLATTLWLRRKRDATTALAETTSSAEEALARSDARFRAATKSVADALHRGAQQLGQGHFRRTFLLHYTNTKISMDPVYRHLVSLLPEEGTVVDIGTGFGFVPLLLAELYPDRPGQVLGFDYDETKVHTGQAAASALDASFVRLEVGDAVDRVPENAVAICLIDVLHYLDQDAQEALVSRCAKRLSSGGMLVVRDMPKKGGVGSLLTQLGESFAMRFRLNRGKGVTPVDSLQLRNLMESLGLEVSEHPMATGPLADRLWVGSIPDHGRGTTANGGTG
ncbi:MAG: hypothetical protein CL928_09865 [Deltaproteobacteria bacterium]|nr:hypothetical protein [Deltaproteobacteria bacterium]